MFERTRAMIRRITDTDSDTISMDERRAHQRFSTNIETLCRIAIDHSPVMKATIRDISQGGAKILIDQPLEEGSLITVDLPLSEDSTPVSVLACVMHTRETTRGMWSHGCTFSAELAEEDLKAFGAEKTRNTAGDNRVWKRFEAHGTVKYVKIPEDGETNGEGTMVNISPSGVGIMLDQPVEPGTVLRLELQRFPNSRAVNILACAVYLGESTDKGWLIGCNFIHELIDADVKALL
jgi:hypothetical protein